MTVSAMPHNSAHHEDAASAPPLAGQVLGEEFRDAGNGALAMETVRRLSAISPLRATFAVLWSFGMIALLAAAGVLWWHPLVLVPVVVAMGGMQQSLFVLAHDAAHYRLYRTRRLNDLVGQVCGMLAGIPMSTYRVIHRLHHNHLYEASDPDMPQYAGYPRGGGYLLKKLARDLAGLTAYKTYAYFLGAPALNTESGRANRPLDDTSPRLRAAALRNRWAVIAFHLAAPVAAFVLGWGWEYLVLWVLPLATVLQAMLRLRAILEHGAVRDRSTPFLAARTNLAPAWLRWWLFSHHVNYHIEHHLYPSIPHYNLPAVHKELLAAGLLRNAEVAPLSHALRRVFGLFPAAA